MASISGAGLNLIKTFEGFRSGPYRDSVGVWTIGYGETRGIGPETPPVTMNQASELLAKRVNRDFLPAVVAANPHLNQNEIDALCSFVYNVGPGGVGPNTSVGRLLRAGLLHQAADALLAWDRAGGSVLPGLASRRRQERALFLKPDVDRKKVRWARELAVLRFRAHTSRHWTRAARVKARVLKRLLAR